MTFADDYTALYGPFAGPGGVLVPSAAIVAFLSLVDRSFEFRTVDQGDDAGLKLVVTPPRDEDGQPVSLTEAERDQIKRYKQHFLLFVTMCEKPLPLRSETSVCNS